MEPEIFLHYDALARFRQRYFKDLLAHEHIASGQIKIDKVDFPDESSDEKYNFWGYILEKGRTKYLLSCLDRNKNEIDIKELLPIKAMDLQKVSVKGIVYYMIHNPIPMKFKSLKSMPFRNFVDTLDRLPSSNPKHKKLLLFFGLASMMERVYFRLATPPGFGKDSIVDTMGHLIGSAGTIENPSIAKLEERANTLKWLAVNEVVNVSKMAWLDLQTMLLAMAGFKPEVTKRSKAHGSVGEIINLSNFSLSLMYNDIVNIRNRKKYFDNVADDQLKDRFPAFRLYGESLGDFNKIKDINLKQYVINNMGNYKELVYNFTYYKDNISNYLHNFSISKLDSKLPKRWTRSLGMIVKIVDMYCETQEEFDDWINEINQSMKDYKEMLLYPAKYEALLETLRSSMNGKDYNKEYNKLSKALRSLNTFIDKNILLDTYKLKKKKDLGTFYD